MSRSSGGSNRLRGGILIGILAMACVLPGLAGCRRHAAPQLPLGAGSSAVMPLPRGAGPTARPAGADAAPLTVRPVAGWSLTEKPIPGVAYRYIRDQAQGDFRPTVTIVARGTHAESLTAARDRALSELRGRYPSIEVLSERAIEDWEPPLHQATYRFAEDGVSYRLMQLYFLRSSGEVVTVTFAATASQWDYLQADFQSILAAIKVEP